MMRVPSKFRSLMLFTISLGGNCFISAADVQLGVESGAVWFSRNDARIPGDTGTEVDLLDLTGTGPDAVVRLSGVVAFNDRHSLRLTLAPV